MEPAIIPTTTTTTRRSRDNDNHVVKKLIIWSLSLSGFCFVTASSAFHHHPYLPNKSSSSTASTFLSHSSRIRLITTTMTTTTTAMSNDNNKHNDNHKESGCGVADDTAATSPAPHPFSLLPGDPSLILTTNLDLGNKKMDIMKSISKAIAKHTGKPEQYVAVCINDKADVIFAGTDAPAALGTLCSIGSINKTSNGKITSDVTDLLEEFGLDQARIYINFFDLDRANIGWSRSTFAG